jgi:hypothetical protein
VLGDLDAADSEARERVTEGMLQMGKLDIDTLKQASRAS